jgi:ribosomal protein S27E
MAKIRLIGNLRFAGLRPILWHNSINFMQITCPTCRAKVATDDINVSTDVALCRSCGNTFHISEALGGTSSVLGSLLSSIVPPSGPVDLNSPPAGAWYAPAVDGFTAGASTRSWMALFVVPFTCVWSGGSMTGIYGTQLMKGHFNLTMSLFGLPFLIGSIFLVLWCAMSVGGKVTVSVQGDRLAIFTGVGPFGVTRTANLSDFKTVREDFGNGSMNTNNRLSRVIRLEGARAMAFGSMLSNERRYFLLGALKTAFSGSSPSPIFVSR